MKFTRTERPLIAWMLYASVLFSLFACGIHHGQMSGLALSGLGGAFCSATDAEGAGIDDSGKQLPQLASQYSCPLCSSFAPAVALSSIGWQIDAFLGVPATPIEAHSWPQPPPRELWPSLNPRASPTSSSLV